MGEFHINYPQTAVFLVDLRAKSLQNRAFCGILYKEKTPMKEERDKYLIVYFKI